jgi:hypothetical protein
VDPLLPISDVSIDAASLATQNEIRDADVKGPDFLDAARFTSLTYRGKGIRRAGLDRDRRRGAGNGRRALNDRSPLAFSPPWKAAYG